MTYTTPASYWEAFCDLGKDKLKSAGINYRLITNYETEALFVKLQKGETAYVLFFSTHHLDFNDGVMVCKSADERVHYDQLVLPVEITDNNRYGYSKSEIERLIADLINNL